MDNRRRAPMEHPHSAASAAQAQNIFVSSNAAASSLGALPPNVFFTICDNNSEECDEYATCIDSNALHQIKEEEDGGEESPLSSGTGLPVQYRLVNQVQRPPSEGAGVTIASAMQLPSGCEIYLIKDYAPSAEVAAPSADLPASSNATITTTTQPAAASPATPRRASAAAGKRSYILEAYKKRDDKRRATHNEVERRRRDKINNWIFKLKEMLPAEPPSSGRSSDAPENTASEASKQRTASGSGSGNCRSPQSDSKSQILIKACEYIKTMQEELQSLRSSAAENEKLRASNERLRLELQQLRGGKAQQQHNNNNNSNNGSASNTTSSGYNLTPSPLNGAGLFGQTLTAGGAALAKRELIVRDYVD